MGTKNKKSTANNSQDSEDILLRQPVGLLTAIRHLHNSELEKKDVAPVVEESNDDEEEMLDNQDNDQSEVPKNEKKEELIQIVWKPLTTLNAAAKKSSKKDKKTSALEDVKDPSELLNAHSSSKPDRDSSRERKWHELPRVEITEDLKRDLRLLHLRSAYDPKKFYKTMDRTKFPTRFAVGTVEDGSTDYYGGRLARKQRGTSLTKELLADESISKIRKKRFQRLQDAAAKHQKVRVRKTDLKRSKGPHHRPKH